MGQHTTSSERRDELPLLIYWLKQMRVDIIIDSVLGPPHGNWDVLSYGEVARVFLTHIVMQCTHFLSPVEAWAAQQLTSLSQALGKPVRAQDCTDDRLAVVLSKLGEEQTRPGDAVEAELGQHLIRAYALPTETARIDLTTVAVHHQPPDEDGLMRFGYSKDPRPDLRQFKARLGTLDPVGLPVATATLSGEQADDPHYFPAWERLVATLGRPDFLVVGECQWASLENRARIHQGGGSYLTPLPLPLTGQAPAELQAWVLDPPVSPQAIRLPGQAAHEPPVGQGFEVAVACRWQDPHTRAVVTWTERRVVGQSAAHAQTQRAGLSDRLAKAQAALTALNTKPATDRAGLETRARAMLTRYRVTDYLGLSFRQRVARHTRYVGRGRPGPQRPPQLRETHTWTVGVHRRPAALARCERWAGWRVYVTNTPSLSLAGAVNCYRQQWQPEHGFQRLKGGLLAITPLFLRDEDRLRALLVLLSIALRVLTLTEFVVRRDLAATGEPLTGLYAGNPKRATTHPTAERLLKAFAPITLYRHDTDTAVWYEVTPLSPLQRRILHALGIPESVYAPPTALLIDSS